MKLNEARRRVEVTQQGLADGSGLNLATIRRIEQGAVTNPTYSTVAAICRVVGRSPEEIDEFARAGKEAKV